MGSLYEVEVTITSANGLKNVNWRHGKLRPYAVVWIDSGVKHSTRVDEEGDASPYWDQKLTLPLDSPLHDSTLFIDVVHAEAADDTKPLIGSAALPLHEAADASAFDKKLDLKRPSGRPQGKIDVRVAVREPSRYPPPGSYSAHPYGVPPPGTRDFYGNPNSSYGYAAPPPSGYPAYEGGYGQPAPAVYGQGGGYYGQGEYAAAADEKKKSKFGGMGTGLAVGAVAGAVGGIALMEGYDALTDHIADEAAEQVEDGGGEEYDDE